MGKKYNCRKVVCVTAVLLFFGYITYKSGIAKDLSETMSRTLAGSKAVVVLDAGHGGFDPGKIGCAGTKEKDINLAIAIKTKKILEKAGYTVVMTREKDIALGDSAASHKKLADLKERVSIIENSGCAVAVSIHQNSYSADTKGAQVFYYATTEMEKGSEVARFAGIMQETIKDFIGDGNKRVEKGNNSYYMLKNVKCPFLIVECGFLSNPQEEALLATDEYQERMAQAIAHGIENYIYDVND